MENVQSDPRSPGFDKGCIDGMDPQALQVVDMVIEIQAEKTRVKEAIKARDAVVQRLADAYESLRQKTFIIERLQQQKEPRGDSPFPFKASPTPETVEIARLRDDILRLENTIKDLRDEIRLLKETPPGLLKSPDPPPYYEEGLLKGPELLRPSRHTQPFQTDHPNRPPLRLTISPNLSQGSSQDSFSQVRHENTADDRQTLAGDQLEEPGNTAKTRNAILANIPLPKEVPDDTLSPLSIPPSFTLQEFLSSMSGPLRSSLANYRLFYALTTLWCPEREEHGYFYTPVFKCSTNPRVATAHRWNAVDVIGRMNKPTECFYNKDGTWYYAGIYKAFLMDNLNTREWGELPAETAQAIVKETISNRKNTSPQNVYEVSQLYTAGALKVACVGLQCVGFNNTMYKALLEQASKFAHGKWKAASPVPSSTLGLGTGTIWNSAVGVSNSDVVDTLGALSLGQQGLDRNENTPVGNR